MAGADKPVDPRIYRMMVEQVRDYALFVLDPSGHILTWNAGAQRLKGYAAEVIIGRHFSIFYTPEAVGRKWPAEELRRATRAFGRLGRDENRPRSELAQRFREAL